MDFSIKLFFLKYWSINEYFQKVETMTTPIKNVIWSNNVDRLRNINRALAYLYSFNFTIFKTLIENVNKTKSYLFGFTSLNATPRLYRFGCVHTRLIYLNQQFKSF